jgi:hypothetical protein
MNKEYSKPLGDSEGNIITRQEDISARIKLEDENLLYPVIEKANSRVMSRDRPSIDSAIEGHARNLNNVRNYYGTLDEREIEMPNKFKKVRSIQKSANFSRLSSLKKNPDASNPFLASDFRGLLIADYNEALNNWDIGYRTLTNIQQDRMEGTRIRINKRKSNATNQLFPSPYDMTKFKMSSSARFKKNNQGFANKTASGFFDTTPKNPIKE